jgi:glycosyltransferase involved in cell wall biosynthesis
MQASSTLRPRPLVSVLTPTIVGREAFLEECMISVNGQTYTNFEHLVKLDSHKRGCAQIMNQLARKARGQWLLPLADDDLLLPAALETLLEADGDIIWSPPLVWGNDSRHFFGEPPEIPSFALIRKSVWEELGGYEESSIREEDRKLWTKALEAGKVFTKVDSDPTWVYRHHGGNKSYNMGVAS